jgi:hypothetical protein
MAGWLIPVKLHAQSWEFIREKDSIRIYTRTEPNSSLKSFKGEMTITSSMDKVKDRISNVKNFDWWDDDITEIRVLKFIPDSLIQYYIIYDVPWPLANRDLCVQAQISTDEKTGVRTIYSTPLPGVIPETDDMVRIKNYWQRWTIQPEGNGRIHLILEGFVDPGGNVPSWLYNMVITNTPWKVMSSLRDHL